MGLIGLVARIFIDFFGITPPEPTERRRMEWALFGLSAGVVAVVAGLFLLLVHAMSK